MVDAVLDTGTLLTTARTARHDTTQHDTTRQADHPGKGDVSTPEEQGEEQQSLTKMHQAVGTLK